MPNIASKMAQHRANIGQLGANRRQHRPNIGPTEANIGLTCSTVGSIWAPDVLFVANISLYRVSGPSAAENFSLAT